MYHDPQQYNQPPLSRHPTVHNQNHPNDQPWQQPHYQPPPPLPPPPQSIGAQQFPNPQSSSYGHPSWNGGPVLGPMSSFGPSYQGQHWSHSPTGPSHSRADSMPHMDAVPKAANMVPPEHAQALDRGNHPGHEPPIPQSTAYFHSHQPSNPPTPAPYPHALPPQPFPQMGPPHTENLPPVPPSSGQLPDLVRVRSYTHSHFVSPPPPPPLGRGQAPAPHAPHLLPTNSEPQLPTMNSQHPPTAHMRQTSLPAYPPIPDAHVSNLLPPMPSAPSPPTPAPSFPTPFGVPPGHVRVDSTSWVGGIAPRPNTYRPPFQPDWNHMPPIPQAAPMGIPPPPSHTPAPTLTMPVPSVGSSVPPPVPPLPKDALMSPNVLASSRWSDGLHRSGTVTTNKLPLPPKEPVPPTNQLPLPPKVPVVPPKEPQPVPNTSTTHSSPMFVSSPLVDGSQGDEPDLQEALRQSLADSPLARGGDDEDYEFQRALAESLRVTSLGGAGFDSPYHESPTGGSNMGSGAWTPHERRDSLQPERDGAHGSRPSPPAPQQEAGPSTLERPARPTASMSAPLLSSGASSSPAPAAELPGASSIGAVDVYEDRDEPPPPTYEEVTNSAAQSPAMANESMQPLSTADPLIGDSLTRSSTVVSRGPTHQTANLEPAHQSPQIAEAPVIEIIPPSHHNSLRRDREPNRQVAPLIERASSEPNLPAETLPAQNASQRPSELRSASAEPAETIRRHPTAPVPVVPRPRAASQARSSSDSLPQAEHAGPGFARPRVMSASQANLASAPSRNRVAMFFGLNGSSSSSSSSGDPYRRTWAIDEEPSDSSRGLLLQPPEPSSSTSRLQSRNASKVNLHESQTDAPLTENLLNGVSYGFRDPDPPTPVSMPPADPLPPSVMIGQGSAFHIQAPNFRHLLRLLSHYGGTSIMATPAAIAASKSGEHCARVVLYFVRGNHEREPWICRLFLELHTPALNETAPVADTSELWKDSTIKAPSGPRGKLYAVPGPLPVLPLSLQGLSTFLVTRLESATRASNENIRRLERILVDCYGSVAGAAGTGEEIGGRQKGSGNLSFGGFFSKVKDKFGTDRGGANNIPTYDLISPFHIDEYR